MQRCQSSIAKLVLTVLVICNLVLAQETSQPTAQQIYEQGMEQFNAGQHEEAKKTLGRILDELDPEDIAEQDQETFWLTLQTLDAQPTDPEPITAENLIDQANLALAEKNMGQADALYRQALAHADATGEHTALAIARLSDIKRSRNAKLTEMRRLIKSASADIRDRQLADAERKLKEVQKSGVDLGWFDNNRLQHRLAVLRDHQLEATSQIEAADKAVQAAAEAAEAANVAKDLAAAAAEIAQAADDAANEETLAAIAQAQSRADKAIEAAEQAQEKATEAARSAQMAEERAGQIERTANETASAMAAELESERRAAAESIRAAETRAAELEKIAADAQAARTQQEKETAIAIADSQAELAEAQAKTAELEKAAEQAEAARAISEAKAAEAAEAAQAQIAEAQQQAQDAESRAAKVEQVAQEAQLEAQKLAVEQAAEAEAQKLAEEQAAEAEAQKLAEEQAAEAEAQELAEEQAAEEQAAAEEAQKLAEEQAEQEAQALEDQLARAMKLYAQQRITEGKQAEVAGQYHLAAKHYTAALGVDPNNKQALAARERAEQNATGPEGPLEREISVRKLRHQQAVAEYEEEMTRAKGLLIDNRFGEAMEAVQQAKSILDQNKTFITTREYGGLRARAEDLDAQIDNTRRDVEALIAIKIEKKQRNDEVQRRIEAAKELQEESQRLIARAVEFRNENRFDDALAMIDRVLFRDPNNLAAQPLKDMIEIDKRVFETRRLRKQRATAITGHSLQIEESAQPLEELLAYPPDWPQITRDRLLGGTEETSESRENRRIALKLQDPLRIDFDEQPIEEFIDFLRITTGVNITTNWNALSDAGVERDSPVSFQLNNVAAVHALELALKQVSIADLDPIGYSIIRGIVEISSKRDLTTTTTTRTYDINDLLIQVPRFENAPEFDLDQALSDTGGEGGGSSGGLFGSEGDMAGDDALPTRDEMVESITELVRNTVGDPLDWVFNGGDISSLQELNGNLIVKTTPDNQVSIVQLLNQLRQARAVQIHVETRFLLVDQNFIDEVGLDLDFTVNNVGGNYGPIVVSQDTFGLTARPTTGLPGSFGSAALGGDDSSGRSLDLSLSYLDDLQLTLLVRATQAHKRSISLSAPRLTLMNGQRSYVMVVRQISFVSDVEPISDGVGFDPELSVVNSGVVLDCEATVSADRRYVTMTAAPDLSNVLQPIRRIQQNAVFDLDDIFDNDDTGEEQGSIMLGTYVEAPEIEVTQIRTTVSVPDKGTILMGGQKLMGEVEIEAGLPVLSKVPYLKRFFTNRTTIKDERTLLILIKPTIIMHSEVEDRNFPGLLDNPAEFGVNPQVNF